MNGKLDRFLKNKTVIYLDTAPIIYFIEEHPSYLPCVEEIFKRIDQGILSAFSSYITLMEVLTKPLELQKNDLAQDYRKLLTESAGFDLHPLGRSIAELAAELRARYGKSLKPPDAIQIATAITGKSQLFITNDSKLKVVKEIEVLVLGETL